MPERLQCPVFMPRTSIQCVMEEGHDVPLVEWPGGEPIDHNFGGIGPYTPEMVMCKAVFHDAGNPILCLRQEGHDGPHNFGDVGPYAPSLTVAGSHGWCLPSNVIVPPRGLQEISDAKFLLMQGDREGLKALLAAVDALLPPHTTRSPHGPVAQWTTPAGLWSLEIESRQSFAPVFYLKGPFGRWRIEDPALPHIRGVLMITGAIGEYDA